LVWNQFRSLLETNTSGSLVNEYIFFGGKRISRRDSSSNTQYYFADQLGSARVVTNVSGTILEDCDYFRRSLGLLSSSVNNYLFTGKERDSESGWTTSVRGTIRRSMEGS